MVTDDAIDSVELTADTDEFLESGVASLLQQPTSSPGGQYKAAQALAHQECNIPSFSERTQSRLEKPQEPWSAHKGIEQGKGSERLTTEAQNKE